MLLHDGRRQRPGGEGVRRKLCATVRRCLVVLQLLQVEPQRAVLPGRPSGRGPIRRGGVEVLEGQQIFAEESRNEDQTKIGDEEKMNLVLKCLNYSQVLKP